jgi:PilZ domain
VAVVTDPFAGIVAGSAAPAKLRDRKLTRIGVMARNRMAGRDVGRRRSVRLAVEREGWLSGRQPRPVKVLDLSASGCLVRCTAPIEPDSILDLTLRLGPETIAAKVRVSHACLDGAVAPDEPARFLVGLSFLGLSAREEAALRRFLDDERRRQRSADAAAL